MRIIFRQCYTYILILGTFQVTTKQQVLGINTITSLLYNPTKIAHGLSSLNLPILTKGKRVRFTYECITSLHYCPRKTINNYSNHL